MCACVRLGECAVWILLHKLLCGCVVVCGLIVNNISLGDVCGKHVIA